MASTPLVSIVIPVLRDTRELEQLIETLGRSRSADEGPQVEVIVVNGDPSDQTLEPLRRMCPGIQWAESAPGRATQMNVGARLATGRWLLFLHADTRPGDGWLDAMDRLDAGRVVGGAFAFRLRSSARAGRVLEWGVTRRVRWLGLPYGDQGIFVRRDVFDRIGGYASLPIMEDIDLVRRLRRQGAMYWSSVPFDVSARRWEREGWIRRSLLNVSLVGLFFLGVSPRWLASSYSARRSRPVTGRHTPPVDIERSTEAKVRPNIVVIIPALDEEEAIGHVLDEIPNIATSVTVVDNGSTDRTAENARGRGALVVTEPRRGYGRACLAGLRANPKADVVVFLDADRSDYPAEMTALLAPILDGDADIVLGYRDGVGRPLAARLGTGLCLTLINLLWHQRYRDLGPFRAIELTALDRLGMVDQTWGWTIEMQVKAAEAGLRIVETPVGQRPRLGTSKISGTVRGTLRAGSRMLATIWLLWWTRHDRKREMQARNG